MAHYKVAEGIGSHDATYSYYEISPPLDPETYKRFLSALSRRIVISEIKPPKNSTLFEVRHSLASLWPSNNAHILHNLIDAINVNGHEVTVLRNIPVDGTDSLFDQASVHRQDNMAY